MSGFDPFANQGGAAALGGDGSGDAARLDDLLNRVGSPPSLDPDTSFRTRHSTTDETDDEARADTAAPQSFTAHTLETEADDSL